MEALAPNNLDSLADLERLTSDIEKLDGLVANWDPSQQLTVQALKSAIEALHKEAFQRLIRALKDDPAAGAKLREALQDKVIFGVLSYHGLLKTPLSARLDKAFAEVRPLLQSHGGDVELVAIRQSDGAASPDTIDIRLTGSCHGCPASGQTLSEGIERAVRAHCPEIKTIQQVSRGVTASGEQPLYFISPFATSASLGWVAVCEFDEVPAGSVLERRVKDRSVLLSRMGLEVSCVENSCAHLGMPLEMGEVENGIITCSYHGFRYELSTGICLTVPEVQLKVHAVRVSGTTVEVRLEE
jgi:Fe-S cluster biogenesis protein NfuA/nitrite reductase/ring-hydroxylating ferredoxin subunit